MVSRSTSPLKSSDLVNIGKCKFMRFLLFRLLVAGNGTVRGLCLTTLRCTASRPTVNQRPLPAIASIEYLAAFIKTVAQELAPGDEFVIGAFEREPLRIQKPSCLILHGHDT